MREAGSSPGAGTPHQHSSRAIQCHHTPRRHRTWLLSPSLQLQWGSLGPRTLESTEGQRENSPWQTQAVPQKGTDLGATYMYFYNPDFFFCNVCSHTTTNKQALTLLLHSEHGNELVTWKVLSLTWAVHVQRGKKKPSLTNTIISAGISLSLPPPSIMMKYRLDFFFKAESYHSFKSFKKHRQINTLFFLTTTALTLSHRPVF